MKKSFLLNDKYISVDNWFILFILVKECKQTYGEILCMSDK